ncbi:hypothetical protein [Bremerella alba]|uniref:Lipoprotein n=1 Tax=Bremerella alba TaxID=980252 RepID=A0A7V8V8K8_9BACT|nr:hypothetical protein [Bremerella alba]MBA2116651.1 hypothetical protein [Bremerella alba]
MRSTKEFDGWLVLLLVGCLSTATGCIAADDGWNRQAVDGMVTLHGEALDSGAISFEPMDLSAGTSAGTEIHDGQFAMDRSAGLPPGEYIVRIYSADLSSAPAPVNVAEQNGVLAPRERIPRQWNTESRETITVVNDDVNTFELNIP